MQTASVGKTFLRYTFFSVLGMVGISCYILADTFFIARGVGRDGLTALNLALPAYSVLHGTGLMIGMGAATRFSLLQGRGETEKGNRVFTSALCFALAFGVLYLLCGLFLARPISYALGARGEVLDMTADYLGTFLKFSPAFMVNNVMLCFIRNDKNPNLAMISMLSGSFLNIALDYVFVFPCNMGMFGAALATGFAPMLGVLLSSVHFLQRKNTFRLVRALPSFRHFGDMCALRVSSFITELSSGLVILVFNVIILRLNGDVGVAAYGVIANISLVVLSVFTGIAQGLQPVVSRYLGQGEEKNAAKAMKLALLTAAGFALSAYLFGALFANPIVNIFNRDNDAQLTQIAVHGLYLYFAGFVFAGVNIVTAVYFGGIDLPRESFAISLMRGFIFIIPAAFALSALFDMTGVWLSFPVAEILTACAAVFLLRRHRKKNRLRLS